MSSRIRPLPLNLFGIPFGLTGLAGLWTAAGGILGTPSIVANLFWVIAAAAWLATLIRYLAGVRSLRAIIRDLKHPVLGPFAALVPVVATLFGEHVHADSPGLGRVWVLTTTFLSFLFAAWFVSQLAAGAHDLDQVHSGYFLPTVAGGLISAQSLATVGYHGLALGAFGAGILFWFILGAITLQRLAFRPQPPAALVPTLAIFSAPPAVAGNAWFAIQLGAAGAPVDAVQHVLFGTFLLLLVMQFFLIGLYVRTPFSYGFWGLTFTAAASGRYAAQIIDSGHHPAVFFWLVLIVVAVTALVAVIAAASVRLAIHTRRAQPASNQPPALVSGR